MPRPKPESPLEALRPAPEPNIPPPRPRPPHPANGAQGLITSLAIVAARKAAGFSTRPHLLTRSSASLVRPPPAPPISSSRNWSVPSSFTLSLPGRGSSGIPKRIVVDDSRWKFKHEDDLPEPRPFQGVKKVYRSGGEGNSIPLDIKALG